MPANTIARALLRVVKCTLITLLILSPGIIMPLVSRRQGVR